MGLQINQVSFIEEPVASFIYATVPDPSHRRESWQRPGTSTTLLLKDPSYEQESDDQTTATPNYFYDVIGCTSHSPRARTMALTTSTVTTKLLNLQSRTSCWTRALQGRSAQLQGATMGTICEGNVQGGEGREANSRVSLSETADVDSQRVCLNHHGEQQPRGTATNGLQDVC